MKNIMDDSIKSEVINRIEKINAAAPAKWGKMNANRNDLSLCRSASACKWNQAIQVYRKLNADYSFKWLILTFMKAPKGKIETVKELKQGVGGTKPINFENDKKSLIELVKNFDESFKTNKTAFIPLLER